VWGMPGQVAAAGYADGIFPLNAMAGEIGRRVQAKRSLLGRPRGDAQKQMPEEQEAPSTATRGPNLRS
jgi:hypothetical protein